MITYVNVNRAEVGLFLWHDHSRDDREVLVDAVVLLNRVQESCRDLVTPKNVEHDVTIIQNNFGTRSECSGLV